MKAKNTLIGTLMLLLGAQLSGCSFSASASVSSRKTIEGKEKIVVTAERPAPEPVVERKAKVEGKKITITEKVMFDTAKATIKAESHGLLNDVAAVMKENAYIKKIRIEGHTDSDGKANYNKKLSQDRANSVKAFLIEAGIDKNRMESVGYGMDKPIADNKTVEGKEKNRRVEFNIIDQEE